MQNKLTLGKIWRSSAQMRIGLILLALVVLCAIFAPLMEPYDPYKLGDDLKAAPCASHLMGTDAKGRDVFSMVLEGARTSLMVGVLAALISGVVGTLVGGAAGYLGGRVDAWISEIINIFLMLPTFFLVMIVVALFGSSMMNVMLIIGLTSWPGNARLMRVQAMSIKERTFVKSAVAMGESKRQILFKYIIPNGLFPVIANTTMGVAKAILTEASLSFLGLGDPNVVSWGQMIFDGKQYLTSGWWMSTFAGLCIMLIVMIFYLIGDGLNYALNPKMKKI